MGKLAESVRVSPLIVVPGDDLDELRADLDSSISVKDGRSRVVHEVGRHNGIFGVTKDVLEVSLGSFRHLGFDVSVGGVVLQTDGQVNNGNVDSRYAEGHTCELTIKLRDDSTDGLGGTSAGGDNVLSASTSSTPVFSSLGRSINSKLVHGDSMDSSHESLLNSPVVVEDLGHGSQAVGSAGSVGYDVHVAGVEIVVNSHNKNGRLITGRGRQDDFLGSTSQVLSSRLGLGEGSS